MNIVLASLARTPAWHVPVATIGGAALDVFAREPLSARSPYWNLPNVLVAPHVAGVMEDYWRSMAILFTANVRRYEAGQPLLNVVDKQAGY